MKQIFSLVFSSVFFIGSYSQKPPINTSTHFEWERVAELQITADGNYVCYYGPGGSELSLQSIKRNWFKSIGNAFNAVFSDDSRCVFFTKSFADSLYMVWLGKSQEVYLGQSKSFKTAGNKRQSWLAYLVKTGELKILNLTTGNEIKYANVIDYHFAADNTIVLQQKGYGDTEYQLQYINLLDVKGAVIWQGGMASNIAYGQSQLAFIIEAKKNNKSYFSIGYYKKGMSQAKILVENEELGLNSELSIAKDKLLFSKDGDKVFFKLENLTSDASSNSVSPKMFVLDYRQKEEGNGSPSRRFDAVVDVNTNKVIQLTKENEVLYRSPESNDRKILIWTNKVSDGEPHWRMVDRPSLYIASTTDGSRKLLAKDILYEVPYQYAKVSPGGNYVTWFNKDKMQYYVYNVKTDKIINVTQKIPYSLYDEEYDRPDPSPAFTNGVVAWLPNDKAMFVYDRYDIWKVDPTGISTPINVTGGFGRKNNTVLRLIEDNNFVINERQETVLMGFNLVNKYNGFYKITFDRKQTPELLTMGPYIYHLPIISVNTTHGYLPNPPIKAKEAKIYVVKCMSATKSPNYFSTSDFKKYKELTNVQPQKKYNWLTSELVYWSLPDGKQAEGILYKPENFDSTKSYPIIFLLYEKFSHALNEFIKPEAADGPLNIPEFVSNEYLVVLPNIYYKIGETGSSIVNSVIPAVQHLSTKPWVDKTRIGIQGHSFGGYEINFLITQTNLFAAAASAAGLSDLISVYPSRNGRYNNEIGQNRLMTTPWDNPEVYVRNSPIFGVNRVTTPLMILHNKGDLAVPFQQGIEMFTALRRAGKSVWLLQYDNGAHQLEAEDGADYSKRLMHFFDHYLKGKPPAIWMTQAGMGYELDPNGSCGSNCKICKDKKYQ